MYLIYIQSLKFFVAYVKRITRRVADNETAAWRSGGFNGTTLGLPQTVSRNNTAWVVTPAAISPSRLLYAAVCPALPQGTKILKVL